jgi:hypothetical protein
MNLTKKRREKYIIPTNGVFVLFQIAFHHNHILLYSPYFPIEALNLFKYRYKLIRYGRPTLYISDVCVLF